MTVTEFGEFPGVKTTTTGGTVAGAAIGAEEYLVLLAEANPTTGSASVETKTQIFTQTDAQNKFGDGTKLAAHARDALENGANEEYLYGIIVDSNWSEDTFSSTDNDSLTDSPVVDDVEDIRFYNTSTNTEYTVNFVNSSPGSAPTSSETVDLHPDTGDWYASSVDDYEVTYRYYSTHSDSAALGTLPDYPVVEDTSLFNARDTTNSQDLTVKFRYASAPPAPSASDVIHVNPNTGEWATANSISIDFEFVWNDWSDALDAADGIINEDESGVYAVDTESASVHGTISTKLDNLRDDYKLAQAVSIAQPNDDDGNGNAVYDEASYTDTIDNDAFYLVAPSRFVSKSNVLTGGVGGLFAGHDITEPVYNDVLTFPERNVELQEQLSRTNAENLRSVEVIPVRDRGSIRVEGNISTSTATDWDRTFFTRRIVDRVILLAKVIGDAIIGRINDDDTRKFARDRIRTEIENLVDDRLLRGNGDGTNWYVDVREDPDDDNKVIIEIGITPYGVVKRVDETITISTT